MYFIASPFGSRRSPLRGRSPIETNGNDEIDSPEQEDRFLRGRYDRASSRARRTSTLESSLRYSALRNASEGGVVPSSARAAAAAGSAPPASASSTPEARSGVSPMFVSATAAEPFCCTAATPTIAQSIARRLNFR